MNKIFKQLFYVPVWVAMLAVGACSDDILPEITDLAVSRLFSPVDVEVNVVNQTGVRLNWKAVNKATSYDIELHANADADFSGAPAISISDVTYDDVPYTIRELDGETDYSVRIRAVGEGIDESKWISAVFKTDAEQILTQPGADDIQATSITLRWPAGQIATQIVLTPGDISHDVTADEVESGTATIDGLTGETTYTAKLMNGEKTRGTLVFTTLIDLGGAIAVYPEDDLTAILQGANDGDVFALLPGEYATQDIAILKSIAIKGARPSNKPILKGTIFRPDDGAGLELKDLILDGTGAADGNQTIVYAAGTFAPLLIEDCEITNYIKGTLYVNQATLIESVAISGTVYSNIECNGGDFIDFRNGIAASFVFENNTAYNSALARDFFRMDAGGSTNFPDVVSQIVIRNNTFNQVCNGNNRRILYIRLASHSISFTKNVLANTEGYYTNQGATTITVLSQNNYFNAPNFMGSTQSNAQNDTGDFTTHDPGFADAANGDFTVSNEELKLRSIGDPRWLQ